MSSPEQNFRLGQLVTINNEIDIVSARKKAREAVEELGFSVTNTTRVVTAVSELARNIFRFAGKGEVLVKIIERDARQGIEIVCHDDGPGIADIDQAMQEGYTSGGGLGMGLPGSKRLMDEMEVESSPNQGTTITIRKWAS